MIESILLLANLILKHVSVCGRLLRRRVAVSLCHSNNNWKREMLSLFVLLLFPGFVSLYIWKRCLLF